VNRPAAAPGAGNRLRAGAARDAGALLLFAALTVAHTWPLATAPGSLSRHDNGDALLNEWAIAWVVHQLPRDPVHLFDANIFYPERNTLAYSEHMFTESVMAIPLFALGLSTTAVHNLLEMLGLTLTAWGMYLVTARWTGDRAAALVAGCLMAFNAHLLTRLAHLQALHVEFLPFTLYWLDRLLEEPKARYGVWLAVFFVLQSLCSNYLMVFTVVALAAAALSRPGDWLGGRARRVAPPLALAGGLAVAALVPFLLPYYQGYSAHGFLRTLAEVAMYSASWRDYLATGSALHFATWSQAFWSGGTRTALFPGVTALVLGGVAVGSGLAFSDRRARMWLAVGLAGFALSFGTGLPGYRWLYHGFPLLQGIRAPARFGLLPLAAFAGTGGFAVAWLRREVCRGAAARTALAVVALALVTAEAYRGDLGFSRALVVPEVYRALAAERRAVVAELPLPPSHEVPFNAPYMLYSTVHWKPMLNGYSGFVPGSYFDHLEALRDFPEPATLAALVDFGVTHVVVHRRDLSARLDEILAFEPLAREPGTWIYRLRWDRVPLGLARAADQR